MQHRKVTFKRVCAWCGKVMGRKKKVRPEGYIGNEIVMHGICNACSKKIKEEEVKV